MSFFEIPFVPVRAEATESRLEKIYDAARMGLKGDSLALAAGLAPKDFRKLASLDPLVEIAEAKGRADGEVEMARTIYNAAKQGDTKAALDMLKHAHGWVAKQQIDVSVDQQISITGALEKARSRVIEGFANLEKADLRVIETQYTEVESAPTPSTILTDQQGEFVDGYRPDNARTPAKSTDV